MESNNELKRTAVFAIIAILTLMVWNYFNPQPQQPEQAAVQTEQQAAAPVAGSDLPPTKPITVSTDTLKAVIDENSGDLRGLDLLKHNSAGDASKTFTLLSDNNEHKYLVQSLLIDQKGNYLLQDSSFKAPQNSYTLNGDTLEVRLSAPETNGVQVDKVYTFRKGSYLIDVRFDIANHTDAPLKLDGVYRVLRDSSTPEGSGYFNQTYVGPVAYTPDGNFQKVPFKDLDDDFESKRDRADYQRTATSGWVGFTQHYFTTVWVLQPKDGNSICQNGNCLLDIKRRSDNLYSAGVRVPLPAIAAGQKLRVPAELYAGPQEYAVISKVADRLELVKDYGRTHVVAAPLFGLLNWLHSLIGNWGWSIVLLTIIVKTLLLPLTNASYRSMAKMRAVAPKLEMLKKQHGDDRMALQQAMMKMYKDEKINPLGGCLPMLLQFPVFIGLYWVLLASVELRQASWGWVADLARPDPLYILPILMALTMYIQTKLSPPPSDPMQAKMMKIMPLAFSVMFFFFPAGLVLYYVVNNLLSMGQQWLINRKINGAVKS